MTSDDDLIHPLPGGGAVRTIGDLAIESRGAERIAICRRCGTELARWTARELPPPLRCDCRRE